MNIDVEYMENKELHELEARKNALDIVLSSTLPQTVDRLELMLNALLAAQNQTTMQRFETELAAMEKLMPDTEIREMLKVRRDYTEGEISEMTGITGIATAINAVGISQRQLWRIERDQLTEKIDGLRAAEANNPPEEIAVPPAAEDK